MSILKVNQIQDRGGNTLLTSDGAGTISSGGAITNTPSFISKISGTLQSITTGTFTKVQFDTAVWDSDSAFDTTNYRFVTPSGKSGKYLFTFGVYADNIDDQEYFENYFFKNGSSINYGRFTAVAPRGSNPSFYTTSVTVDMNVSDYMEIFVYHNDGSTNAIYSDTTFFSGHRLIGA